MKDNTSKKLTTKGDKFDFLDDGGQNIQIAETFGSKKPIEIEKAKINKQFKLLNPVPKF